MLTSSSVTCVPWLTFLVDLRESEITDGEGYRFGFSKSLSVLHSLSELCGGILRFTGLLRFS